MGKVRGHIEGTVVAQRRPGAPDVVTAGAPLGEGDGGSVPSVRERLRSRDLAVKVFVAGATYVALAWINKAWAVIGAVLSPIVSDLVRDFVERHNWSLRRLRRGSVATVLLGHEEAAYASRKRAGRRRPGGRIPERVDGKRLGSRTGRCGHRRGEPPTARWRFSCGYHRPASDTGASRQRTGREPNGERAENRMAGGAGGHELRHLPKRRTDYGPRRAALRRRAREARYVHVPGGGNREWERRTALRREDDRVSGDSAAQFHNPPVRLEPHGIPTIRRYPKRRVPTGLHAVGPIVEAPRLEWNAIAGADHYVVYRDGNPVATAPRPEYRDTTVERGTYVYQVSAVIARDQSGRSESVGVQYALAAPVLSTLANPTNHPPRFSWTDVPGAEKYVVYRGGQEITRTQNRGFADPTRLADGSYTYEVAGLDSKGNLGSRGTLTVVYDTTPPSTPTGFGSASSDPVNPPR